MTPLPVQLSAPEFTAFLLPHLTMPKRGPKCKLGYHRLFNLILWVLYTPTVSPFLTPVSSRNALLLQSLPTTTSFWQGNARRRKDDTRVGTAARGIVERLSRLPRRLPSDGGSSGRVRHALSTGARDRGQPARHAPLPPGATVAFATQECRGN